MVTEDYYNRVVVVANFKYELSRDVLEEYKPQIQQCYDNNFDVRRTVEYLATQIFDLN
jgi:hypothetical protein